MTGERAYLAWHRSLGIIPPSFREQPSKIINAWAYVEAVVWSTEEALTTADLRWA